MEKNYRNNLSITFRDNNRIEFNHLGKSACLNEKITLVDTNPILNLVAHKLNIDENEFLFSLQLLLNYIKSK